MRETPLSIAWVLVAMFSLLLALAASLIRLRGCGLRARVLHACCPLSQIAVLVAACLFVWRGMVPPQVLGPVLLLGLLGAAYDFVLARAFAAEEQARVERARIQILAKRVERMDECRDRAVRDSARVRQARDDLAVWLEGLATRVRAGDRVDRLAFASVEEGEGYMTGAYEFDAILSMRRRAAASRKIDTTYDVRGIESEMPLDSGACVFTACILDALILNVPQGARTGALRVRVRCRSGYLSVEALLCCADASQMFASVERNVRLARLLARQCDGEVRCHGTDSTVEVRAAISQRALASFEGVENLGHAVKEGPVTGER